jgi:hypothetical protein
LQKKSWIGDNGYSLGLLDYEKVIESLAEQREGEMGEKVGSFLFFLGGLYNLQCV